MTTIINIFCAIGIAGIIFFSGALIYVMKNFPLK